MAHGGAEHASTHEHDPAAPSPGVDPYYFKDDQFNRWVKFDLNFT